MSRIQQTYVSADSRRLPVRLRPDLSARKHKYLGHTHWIVKDPLGMKYFRFQDQEYALLKMLDGSKSLEEIQHEFESRFAPKRLRLTKLQEFITRLHSAGLVLVDYYGQGKQLLVLSDQARANKRRAAMTNIFAIRFPGFDPDRLLDRLYRYTWWFFTPAAAAIVLCLVMTALASIVVNFEAFRTRLPSAELFYGPSNMHWLILAMIFCKVLHEFGHGLMCKHFGGECHEMGWLLLFFAPAMYCDVSDSWLLPRKWQRMAIGAGGMYVELFLASLATFIWWLTEPGLLNTICLSVMLLSSVSTVLVNANPLLRFDGYFILSDYLEIPNLAQKARDLLRYHLVQGYSGIELPLGKQIPAHGRGWLFFYAVAAAAYRWFMVFAALWFLHTALEAYDLEVLGKMVAFVGLCVLVLLPIWQLAKLLYVPGRINQMKPRRVLISSAIATAAAFVLFAVPMPYYIKCPAIVTLRDAETIYAAVDGKLQSIDAVYGQPVESGVQLASLTNDDLELSIAQLAGEADELEAELAGLRRERLVSQEPGRRIASLDETLAMIKEQLAERHEERDLLIRRASRSGVVLPPSETSRRRMRLTRATAGADPLDLHNLGMHLAAGDPLCQIGDPSQLEIVILIGQSNREFVELGSKVYVYPESSPFEKAETTLAEISQSETILGPRSLGLKYGGSVASRSLESGEEKLVTAAYQARAPLDHAMGTVKPGVRCHVKIEARHQTLAARLWRWAEETFSFRT